MMRYAVVTFGCKLNQYDSAVITGRLEALGAKASDAGVADLLLVNTCTVTHRADRDARKAIRSLRRGNPGAVVAVMGCSSRLDREAFARMPEVDAVLDDAASVNAFLAALGPKGDGSAGRSCTPCFGDRTRAFLKVQEGCDFPCTYCVIPQVRGPSRSVAEDLVAGEFRALCEAGYREIVLTGINTGEYGKDLRPRSSLVSLLERLLGEPGEARIRLNSVEPRAVTADLLSLMRSEERLARHLQIPLQSGSDAVLAAMKRNYRSAFYRDLVTRAAEEVPDVGLGADVLVGFPSESPADFKATEALIEALPLAFLHAFTYSPRPGTAAAALRPLPASVTGPRTAALRRLSAHKTRAFAARLAGRPLPALTLAPRGEEGRALTDNFLDVALSESLPPNRFVEVVITDAGSLRADVVR